MTMNLYPEEQSKLLTKTSPINSRTDFNNKPGNEVKHIILDDKDQEARVGMLLGNNINGNGNCLALTIPPSETSTTESIAKTELPANWKKLTLKVLAILLLLYLFVCSLGFLSDSFRLIAGRAAGEVLQQENLIKNPIVGVMMGILVTVAVQSSSTSTSIVVSMVASGLFTVKTAIPIIMGANIGTSVTNTVVALTHMSNREDFERAFGGAVLHDMFNVLTVSSLLMFEQLTSYLEVTTTKLIDMLDLQSKKGGEIQVLSVITKPFTSLIVQIDKEVIVGWSINDPKYDNARLVKVWCNSTSTSTRMSNSDSITDQASAGNGTDDDGVVVNDVGIGKSDGIGTSEETVGQKCKFLFNMFNMGDLTIGIILLAISLFLLCGCLILLVKVLSSLLKGKLAVAVQKTVNANIPYVPCLTGYLAIGIGAVMTILVQSSSVFTSAMTPLIAMGMISLERAYPLTLGSNLGTTTTAMLAALATEGPNLKWSIQLALCHFLFNLTGILMFYPIPCTRLPIRMAACLGRITAKYRWFAVFYLVFMFLILPMIVFMLSLIGKVAFYCVASPVGAILILSLGMNFTQQWRPQVLPLKYRNWDFLPEWTHSLEPYDRIVQKLIVICATTCCKSCCKTAGSTFANAQGDRTSHLRLHTKSPSEIGMDNPGFTRNDQSFVNLDMQQTQV